LRLFAGFVNGKTYISTGFLGFLGNFAGFWPILRVFHGNSALNYSERTLVNRGCKRFFQRDNDE
jgi:hypothetical protein